MEFPKYDDAFIEEMIGVSDVVYEIDNDPEGNYNDDYEYAMHKRRGHVIYGPILDSDEHCEKIRTAFSGSILLKPDGQGLAWYSADKNHRVYLVVYDKELSDRTGCYVHSTVAEFDDTEFYFLDVDAGHKTEKGSLCFPMNGKFGMLTCAPDEKGGVDVRIEKEFVYDTFHQLAEELKKEGCTITWEKA